MLRILGLVLALGPRQVVYSKNVVGYVSNWALDNVEDLPFAKLTHVNYAFGQMRKSHPDIYLEPGQKENMQRLLKAAKGKAKVLFSIGGWTGSQTFSTVANHDATVDLFIEDALNYLREGKGYGFDGLDMDWEYPGLRLGSRCNFNSTADTRNYLKLLRKLRARMTKEFGATKLLTAGVRVITFDDENNTPLRNVKEFAKVFDFVNIMAYDIMGSWSNRTGPNAPVYPLKDSSIGDNYDELQLSLATAVRDWTAAGFPADKLNAGIALYGRVTTALKPPTGFLEATDGKVPSGDGVDLQDIGDFCGEGFLFKGVYRYKNLRKDILVNAYNEAKPGFIRGFDATTKTPFVINELTKQFISYEDLDSTRVKIDFIREKGLGGAMVWDLSMDYNYEIVEALQAIRPKDAAKSLIETEPAEETAPKEEVPAAVLSPRYGEIFLSGVCSGGQSTCAKKEISSIYNECVENAWVQKSCPEETVCTHTKDAILCVKSTLHALPSNPIGAEETSTSSTLGQPCESGPDRCIDSLKSPAYQQCNSRAWIQRECPTDQVCVNTPESVSCIAEPKILATSQPDDAILQGECVADAKPTCVNALNSPFHNRCVNYAWSQHRCDDGMVCQTTPEGIACIRPYAPDTSENKGLPKGLCVEGEEYCFDKGVDRRFSKCRRGSWATLKCPGVCMQKETRTFCDHKPAAPAGEPTV